MRKAPGNLQRTVTETLGNKKLVMLAKAINKNADFVENLKAVTKSVWNNPLID